MSDKRQDYEFRGCMIPNGGTQHDTKWCSSVTNSIESLREIILVIEYKLGNIAWIETR